MKSLKFKKIAFASALVAGSVLALNVNAQVTTLYSGSIGTANIVSPSNAYQLVSGLNLSSGTVINYSFDGNFSGTVALPNNVIYIMKGAGIGPPLLTQTVTGSVVNYHGSITLASGITAIFLQGNGNPASTLYTVNNILLTIGSGSSGPSLPNTQASVQNTAQALQGTYTLQNSVMANSFSYDCNVFGANDVCVSAGGRNTAVSAANGLNNTSGLLIAAYRAMANVRVGAYADQNLSVNNGGSTVNLGNNTPLLGLFTAWNERLDGTGTEVKATLAYGQKNTTMNRQVVGTGATASEAGSGSSTLNSQGAQVTAKYGFSVMPEVIVSPYVGIRYTQNNMGGYTEGTSTSVTAPLSYSALNTNATTALAGVGASYRGIPQTTLFASAGVETDTNTANGSFNATNSTIGAITPVNFNPNPVKTRPTATLGASYDVEKNQRLGVTGIYRQEAYQATATTTVMATYTVGF
jgi:hypothetical protein